MRYSLTLPLVLAALAGPPIMAQDVASPPLDQSATVDAAEPVTPAEMLEAQSEPVQADPATPPSEESMATPTPGATSEATPMPAAPASTMTTEQQAAYDGWSAEAKDYFDDLAPARQAIFLRIADPDKAKLVALDAAQQETVWASLEQQDAAQQSEPKS